METLNEGGDHTRRFARISRWLKTVLLWIHMSAWGAVFTPTCFFAYTPYGGPKDCGGQLDQWTSVGHLLHRFRTGARLGTRV